MRLLQTGGVRPQKSPDRAPPKPDDAEADNIPNNTLDDRAMLTSPTLQRMPAMIDKHTHATSTGAQRAPVDVVALQNFSG
jgi:hypothetical protein